MTSFEEFDFGIKMRDDFSAVTQLFRSELLASQQAFIEFRRAIRSLSQDGSSLAASLRKITNSVSARRFNNAAKAVKNFDTALRSTFRVRQEDTRLAGRQVGAEIRLNAELRKQIALIKARNAALATTARLRRGGGGRPLPLIDPAEPARVARTQAGVRRLRGEFDRTARSANRLRIPLANVLGTVFAITAIRQLGSAFRSVVSDAVSFNREIEISTLGIASLLTATGEVRDQFGQAADASGALAQATTVARRQVLALQQDALNTTATLKQLTRAFQEAVAPGITAGLSIDQIRQFSVQVSQAATALGLAQQQLAEEVRSILSGAIQTRTTRIATALGITNEDIERAKEFGNLFEFLQERFSAFSAAGRESLNTFEGLRNRVIDVAERLSGAAGLGFFDELKTSLREIFDILTSEDEFGVLSPSPQAQTIFRAIFDSLTNIVAAAREAAKEVTFSEALDAAEALGSALETVAQVLIGFAQGVVTAFGTIRSLLEPVVDLITELAGEESSLKNIVATFTEIASIVGLLVISFTTIRAILGALTSPIGIVALAITGLLIASEKLLEAFLDVDVTLGDIARLVGIVLVGTFRTLGGVVRVAFNGALLIGLGIIRGILEVVDLVVRNFEILVRAASGFAGVFSDDISDSLTEAGDAITKFRDKIRGLVDRDKKLLAEFATDTKDAWTDLGNTFQSARDDFNTAINDIASGGASNVAKAVENAETLSEAFGAIPPAISTINSALSKVDQGLANTTKTARQTESALQFEISSQGLAGTARQIEQFFAKAQDEATETARTLNDRVLVVTRQLIRLQREQADQASELEGLTQSQISQVQGVVLAERQLGRTISNVTRLKTEQAVLENQIRESAQEGNTLRAEALSNDLDQTRRLLALEEERLGTERLGVDLAGLEADPEAIRIALEIINTNKQLNNTLADREAALTKIAELEQRLAEIATNRAEAAAARASGELAARIPLLEVELDAARRIAAAEAERGVAGAIEAANAENRLRLARAEQEAREDELRVAVAIARERIQSSQLAGLASEEQEIRLQLLEEELSLEERIGAARLAGLEAEQERAELLRSGSLGSGLTEGFLDIAEEIGSQFQAGLDIATGLVNSFTSFVSKSIVDAFDPTKDTSIKEQFGRFLQDIAQLILQKFAELAIARLILGFASPATSLSTAGADIPFGIVKGGNVPRRPRQASLAHYTHPQSFVQGGGVKPPKGVSPRDTQPIWAEPGEFMVKLEAARYYGQRIMQGINNGEIPAEILSQLVGSGRVGRARKGSPGYVSGGEVTQARRLATQIDTASSTGSSSSGSQPSAVVGIISGSETNTERMLANRQMLLEVIEEEGANIESSLARFRG